MTRATTKHLLLFAALLHLLADVAYAGGSILCVGPNDHRAIESEHASALGCPTKPSPDTARFSSALPAAGDCTDSPVHSGAELVASSTDASDVAPQLATSGVAFENDRLAQALLPRARGRDPDLPPELRVHRSTVLLL